jgi:hypothetical protein
LTAQPSGNHPVIAECGIWRTEMVLQKSTLVALTMTFALEVVSAAHAQMTLDVAQITCEQFTRYKISNPENIAIWISGYYAGSRGNTVIDPQMVMSNARKLQDYCFANAQKKVIEAVETVLSQK